MKTRKHYYYTVEFKGVKHKHYRDGELIRTEQVEHWYAVSNALFTLPRAKQMLKHYQQFEQGEYRIVRLKPEVMK